MPSISSYFNPCSKDFRTCSDFARLNLGKRIGVVILSALAIICSLGILAVAMPRLLVRKFLPLNTNNLPNTSLKTHQTGLNIVGNTSANMQNHTAAITPTNDTAPSTPPAITEITPSVTPIATPSPTPSQPSVQLPGSPKQPQATPQATPQHSKKLLSTQITPASSRKQQATPQATPQSSQKLLSTPQITPISHVKQQATPHAAPITPGQQLFFSPNTPASPPLLQTAASLTPLVKMSPQTSSPLIKKLFLESLGSLYPTSAQPLTPCDQIYRAFFEYKYPDKILGDSIGNMHSFIHAYCQALNVNKHIVGEILTDIDGAFLSLKLAIESNAIQSIHTTTMEQFLSQWFANNASAETLQEYKAFYTSRDTDIQKQPPGYFDREGFILCHEEIFMTNLNMISATFELQTGDAERLLNPANKSELDNFFKASAKNAIKLSKTDSPDAESTIELFMYSTPDGNRYLPVFKNNELQDMADCIKK